MSYLKERVSYLKGLTDGMQIGEGSNEGKLLKAIVDVLDDMALAIDDIEEVQEQLSEQVDSIDEDLGEVESILFEDEESDDQEDECECGCLGEFECPHCNQLICLEEDMLEEDSEKIVCPNCKKEIEVEWECNCEECEDSDDKE